LKNRAAHSHLSILALAMDLFCYRCGILAGMEPSAPSPGIISGLPVSSGGTRRLTVANFPRSGFLDRVVVNLVWT
jgi:hypothetical protein